jgi:hypothetical protein
MAVAGLLAIGFLLPACGARDDGATNTSAASAGASKGQDPPPVNETRFIQRANSICKETGGAFFNEMRTVLTGGPSAQQLDAKGAEEYAEENASPALRSELEQLRSLDPPASMKRQFEQLLEAIEDTAVEVEVSPKRFLNSSDALRKAERLADDHGLSSCPFN